MNKYLEKHEMDDLMSKHPYLITWEETDETIDIKIELHKWKWTCENCGNTFNEPEWLESPSSENPICPKCESLNIDLTLSIIKHIKGD